MCEPVLMLQGVFAETLFTLEPFVGADPPFATFTDEGEPAATGPLADGPLLFAAIDFAFEPKVLGAEGITLPVTPFITTI